MNISKINNVKTEITRLKNRIRDFEMAQIESSKTAYPWTHPKETGAIRRASLDLTRALADMRRPG